MEDAQVGWIAAIIIGFIVGCLAEQFMQSQMGMLKNICLGVVGAAIASFLLGVFGFTFGGWPGYLVAGFIGACILIWLAHALRRAA
ncbi:GlsB/YeaQ/YmgE family stress response membrane protein [Pseudorhodoplanes sinuspersici]|uniref:GlsB/YeaQ/YmgE family stress response membrane protein n=1 Tax=Pseudorhodoplanes sinuspersici TaxID=1235591 RepID=A0A1W6ZS77_9HYPH|nr:GlsB/YeaQ/YmgE family stress response membrane protein [Pseudorhodoplanes sinuspersici]ARQ00136.1 GlsB/YeaQ/YmgE family stress response membrane protein [Pseudorhodoplanes sinuspersici]RKE65656.1 putative membrane protein YeaQ/YmgE (transglycosylase-associated protein family) [Pseudorhodoplanes sinuspersici]